MSSGDIVTIDKKEGILLSKNKSNGMFCLWLKVQNPNVNLPTLVNVHLVELLAKLNPDVIENMEIFHFMDIFTIQKYTKIKHYQHQKSPKTTTH